MIFSLILVVTAASNIANPMIAVSKAITASASFFEIIDAPQVKKAGLKHPDASADGDITFKNVIFRYPSRPKTRVLDDLTLTLPHGKLTAIVGPSGSGKSTIVGLLERWYQLSNQLEGDDTQNPTKKEGEKDSEKDDTESTMYLQNSGTIAIGPHNIDHLDLGWWRSQIGLVQQEPFSFNTSIYNNVAYGLIGSEWEHANEDTKRRLVKESCQEAFAAEFVDRLPNVSQKECRGT